MKAVRRALLSGRDVWGNALLASPDGPSYEHARSYLAPLLLGHALRGPFTASGVHYVPFSWPTDARGARTVALHVADGSQIISEHVGGRTLTVGVGRGGRERFGSCLERLALPALAYGYLPILETRYLDALGVRYRQESFAARIRGTAGLVSFVRVTADARQANRDVEIRFTPSEPGLEWVAGRLVAKRDTHSYFSAGGFFDGTSVRYVLKARRSLTVYAVRLHAPAPSRSMRSNRAMYQAARGSVLRYWERRLARGGLLVVPEKRVLNAERSLLIQELGLTWRYSIGNQYEAFSPQESIDVARVVAEYGHGEVSRRILRTALWRQSSDRTNRKMGALLVAVAQEARLSGVRSVVSGATPTFRNYMEAVADQIATSPCGLLQREAYSCDIGDRVYGLHSQTVVWQGLRWMSHVWTATGNRALGARSSQLAESLGAGLRGAVLESQVRLPDGTLFIPIRLVDPERPYDMLTATRAGSYWNLVMPYALASGFFPARSAQADGVYGYMTLHGSRLLGLPRAGAYPLYGVSAHPASGVNPVYGLNTTRYLADSDRPDQLVLSLYGQLAAGMTAGTFVSGEGTSIAPLPGEYFRKTALPPNGASNAAFLETLRLMLVHETAGRDGAPGGLELAYATPRAWLRPGERIDVRAMPTSFGPVSFTIQSGDESAHVWLRVRERGRTPLPGAPLRSLRIRLRFPDGDRITTVRLGGHRLDRFDPRTGTIKLPARTGTFELDVRVERT